MPPVAGFLARPSHASLPPPRSDEGEGFPSPLSEGRHFFKRIGLSRRDVPPFRGLSVFLSKRPPEACKSKRRDYGLFFLPSSVLVSRLSPPSRFFFWEGVFARLFCIFVSGLSALAGLLRRRSFPGFLVRNSAENPVSPSAHSFQNAEPRKRTMTRTPPVVHPPPPVQSIHPDGSPPTDCASAPTQVPLLPVVPPFFSLLRRFLPSRGFR